MPDYNTPESYFRDTILESLEKIDPINWKRRGSYYPKNPCEICEKKTDEEKSVGS